MKKFLVIVVILVLMSSMSIYAVSGNNDSFGGHYEQQDGKAVKYCFYQPYDDGTKDFTGWELTLITPVDWDKRDTLLYPDREHYNPLDDSETCYGTWEKIDVDCNGIGHCEYNITETPEPVETPETSITEFETELPTSGSELPKTGEAGSIFLAIGAIVSFGGAIILVFTKLR